MSSTAVSADAQIPPLRHVVDERRGQAAMLLFIATEATLFLILFFSYFYLAHYSTHWAAENPKLTLAFVMLAVLLSSSAVLWWGERQVERGRTASARIAISITAVMGVLFLAIQAYEYADRLKVIRPTTNAYGSMFYTITGFHGAHVLLGICMLLYVLVLPEIGHTTRPPHRPLHNAGLYWHFVDAVWIVIVALLYVLPNVTR
jgi:heme/copper-type cytochrome/quinol oxidase subunit 3